MPGKNTDRLIGIAMKAGKIKSGGSMCEQAVREGKAALVIVAQDASDNTIKRLRDKCRFYQTPFFLYSDKESLGRVIGKEERSAVAVLDEGLAKAIIKTFNIEL